MGGKFAMAVAARRPERLHALVLCAPSPPTPEPMSEEDRRRQLAAWGDRAEGERSVRGAAASTLSPTMLEPLLADWLATDRTTWNWWWEGGSVETLSVASITEPTTVLGGSADARLGAEAQARLTVPLIAGARLQAVAGAGHLLPIDDPDDVARDVEAAAAA